MLTKNESKKDEGKYEEIAHRLYVHEVQYFFKKNPLECCVLCDHRCALRATICQRK